MFTLREGPDEGILFSDQYVPQDDIQAAYCRLAGYENAFLGNTSRMLPLIKKKLKDANKDAVDVLLFGEYI